eukprot:TRINITY_DN5614_c0_g1_i1.p1 TRINITY_DN5614_c0_g1~~TRINITY_DN5614_c0_g1_i1.p1  ORF type:complete len:201 (+),score=18.39 TRINITY_DN5614_c0_g1_i1:59-604(+)
MTVPQEMLYHTPTFPRSLAFVTLALVFAVYWAWTDLRLRIHTFFAACTFSVIEFTFRAIQITVQNRSPSLGYTTAEQWVMCNIMGPIMHKYRIWSGTDTWAVFGFPFIIWLMEILCGYWLLHFHHKKAWLYTGPFALFHGNIGLHYVFIWWPFAVFHYFLTDSLYVPVSTAVVALVNATST